MFARHLAVAAAAGAVLIVGSAFAHRGVTASTTGPANAAGADSGWTVTLSAPASYSGDEKVTGSGTVTADPSGKGFVAHVNIDGAKASSVHPWHVHTGTCDKSDGIVGEPSAYPPIQVGADGKGMATATISKSLDPSAAYVVNVHESPSNMKTIISCGPLTKE